MKKTKTFCKLLAIVLMTMGIVSCSFELTDQVQDLTENKTFEVQLNLEGDYVDISESPLTRADSTKKYYALNVYCMKMDGAQKYSFYGAGIYDNLNSMKITLLGGYKYKFVCTSATEGNDKFVGYSWLYNMYIDEEDWNSFDSSRSYPLDGLESGKTYVDDKYRTYCYYPRMDRYYGILEDYIPSEGGVATIMMKRCVFGVTMTVNGVPDGKLSWGSPRSQISADNFWFDTYSHTGDETLELSSIYTFYRVSDCWKKAINGEEYSETFSIYFTWERSNGYEQTFSKEFTVKRNVMTNINVNLSGGSTEINIGVNEEGSEMTDEDVNVDYDGGSMNDTDINPEE